MRYLLESLGDERFQQLCQALLVAAYSDTQCLPVGQPDGGRDAFQRRPNSAQAGFNVFQVKFSKSPDSKSERKVIEDVIESEKVKVAKLVEKGAGAYFLLTNVAGTAHLGAGSVDLVNERMSAVFGIPSYCWWRDDIERRLDGNKSVKWSYPEIMRATDLLPLLLGSGDDLDAKRRERAIKAYMVHQSSRDSRLKFKQIDLEKDISELFVDVPAAIALPPSEEERAHRSRWWQFIRENHIPSLQEEERGDPRAGALALLANSKFSAAAPRLVVEGAPGQGKSTITQYLCQLHRMRLLGREKELGLLPAEHSPQLPRIPFRVDLRDYAAWIIEHASEGGGKLLETFLAGQVCGCTGSQFAVDDLHELITRSAILIVLDGFDEVADIQVRNTIVQEVSDASTRLADAAISVQIIVTSRPSAFANSTGFPREEWLYLDLLPLSRAVIDQYATRWISARTSDEREIKAILGTLSDKIVQPHVRDLARNPMQLAILLALISVQGASLPNKRTSLYDEYVNIFLNRESDKSKVVRDHRDLLINLHRFLAWVLQIEAERSGSGNIEAPRLRALVREYLRDNGYQPDLLDDLFAGMVERVVALVSRVQGTFEFEVQPLREYFAARYLYDTAPYVPAGAPSKAGKPERFDALARNFYWLNVTRFYSGCYSSGELASLLQNIEDLQETKDFLHCGYPVELGVALLNDYVFSQHPKVQAKLDAQLVDKGGVFLYLAEYSYYSDVIKLPSGKPSALRLYIKELVAGNASYDVRHAAARVLCVNMEVEERVSLWRELKEGAKDWLSLGQSLQVLQAISSDEAAGLINSYGGVASVSLGAAERSEVVDSSPGAWAQLIEYLLDGGYMSPWRSAPNGLTVERAVAHKLACVLLPFIWEEAAEPDLKDRSLGEAVVTFYFGGAFTSSFGRKGDFGESELAILDNKLNALFEETVGQIFSDPGALIEVFRCITQLWGERSALLYVAINFADQARSQLNIDADLCDTKWSLLERALVAVHQTDSSWWESQIKQIGSHGGAYDKFIIACAFRWMRVDCLLAASPSLSDYLDRVDADVWAELYGNAVYRASSTGGKKISVDWPENLSPRFACLFASRLNSKTQAIVWRRYLRPYEGNDPEVLYSCTSLAVAVAYERPSYWVAALDFARRAYKNGSIYHMSDSKRNKKARPIPIDLAGKVCEEAGDYPLTVVRACASVIRSELGRKAEKVSAVAERDKWFLEVGV